MSPGTGRDDGDDDAGDAPAYVLAACEATACVPIVAFPALPRVAAVGWLAELADRLRAKGGLGRLALLDARTGAVVASCRVWP